MNRFLNLFACLLVGAALLAVGWTVWRQRPTAQPNAELEVSDPKPPIARSPAAVKAGAGNKLSAKPAVVVDGNVAAAGDATPEEEVDPNATPSPLRDPVARRYSWSEVEEILKKLRSERQDRPAAVDDLESWYSTLSQPSYSGSRTIPEHCTKLAAWRQEMRLSPTPLIVLARAHISHAWNARGSGLAFTVTEQGWELFHTRIAEARRLLEQAIKLGVKDGEAHARMLTIAMAEGWPLAETRAVLDAGIKADSAYMPMYMTMAEYLLPRWNGEPGDIEVFAKEMAERLAGDDGLDAFGHIAYVTNRYDYHTLFWGAYDRGLLGKAAEVLVKRYPRSRHLCCFAALATIAAQDHAAARRIQPLVKDAGSSLVPFWEYATVQYQRWCAAEEVARDESHWVWATLFKFGNIGFFPDSSDVWCGLGIEGKPIVTLDPAAKSARFFFRGPGGMIDHVVFDREKNWLVAAVFGDKFRGWVLWDVERPDAPLLTRPVPEACQALAVNPKSRQIAWALAKRVETLDGGDSDEAAAIPLAGVQNMRFSADGKRLALHSHAISVWDAASRQKLYDLANLPSALGTEPSCDRLLDFDEDGRVWAIGIVAGRGPATRPLLRFGADGKSPATLISDLGRRANPHSAVLSPDRKLLAIADVGENTNQEVIQIWDVSTAKPVLHLSGHWEPIGAMAFSSDSSQLASIGQSSGPMKIWSLKSAVAK